MNLHDATELAYKNGYEAGKPKWIPVSRELPAPISKSKRSWAGSGCETSDEVLCACLQKSGKRMVKTGRCEYYGDTTVWRLPGDIDAVTHWMPKPDLPEDGE